jgi:hypothetical protein
MVGLDGRCAPLAHVRHRSPVSVGRYGVEPDRLVPLIKEELVRPAGTVDAYQVGKMECHCPQFISLMRTLRGSPRSNNGDGASIGGCCSSMPCST